MSLEPGLHTTGNQPQATTKGGPAQQPALIRAKPNPNGTAKGTRRWTPGVKTAPQANPTSTSEQHRADPQTAM